MRCTDERRSGPPAPSHRAPPCPQACSTRDGIGGLALDRPLALDAPRFPPLRPSPATRALDAVLADLAGDGKHAMTWIDSGTRMVCFNPTHEATDPAKIRQMI